MQKFSDDYAVVGYITDGADEDFVGQCSSIPTADRKNLDKKVKRAGSVLG